MDPKLIQGLMDSMVRPEDMKFRFKGLLYGDPGAWKTTTGCTIGNKILFLAADPEGWQSLVNHPELGLGSRIQLMEYKGLSQLEALADAFAEDLPLVREFDTVNLDTLSRMSTSDLAVVQKEKIKKKPEFDFEKDMWPVYNQNAMRMRNALGKLLDAPINVIATAHAKEIAIKKFGSETGERRLQPKFPPEVFADVNAQFSMIAYMQNDVAVDRQDKITYKPEIQFHPTPLIVAKTRIGGLPVKLRNPNLKEIVENWQKNGAQLMSHEEAEMIRPSSEGIETPVATNLEDLI